MRLPPANRRKFEHFSCQSYRLLKQTGSVACVSVVALVGADCSTRLRAQNAIDGSAVITGACESALQLGDSGVSGLAILTIAIAIAVVAAVLVSPIAVAITVTVRVAVAVGAVAVRVTIIGISPVPAGAPAPPPPPRKAEGTDEDYIIMTMMMPVVPVSTVPIAAMAPIAAVTPVATTAPVSALPVAAPVSATPVAASPALASPSAHSGTRGHSRTPPTCTEMMAATAATARRSIENWCTEH